MAVAGTVPSARLRRVLARHNPYVHPGPYITRVFDRGQISARRGIILSGTSGTGKTAALTQPGRTHERSPPR